MNATPQSLREAVAGKRQRRCLAIRNWICRLDVCAAAFFFCFLLGIACLTSAVSQILVSRSLQQQWRLVHHVRVTTAKQRIESDSERVRDIATAFLAAHARSDLPTDTEETIRYLCASLDRYDTAYAYRALAYLSIDSATGAGCAHGMAQMGSMQTMTGWFFTDHVADGTYLVNGTSYYYTKPLRQITVFPPGNGNASTIMPINYGTQRLFPMAKAYHNGSISSIDPRYNWMYPARMPHLIFYNLPIGEVIPGEPLKSWQSASDFVQVRLDGSTFLISSEEFTSNDFSAAAFIRQSLNTTNPLIFSNSWGQQAVSNNSIYSPSVYFNVTYLSVVNITDPLMRAALRHVNLRALQGTTYAKTKQFAYRGATAFVTSVLFTTNTGLTVPLVFASQQRYVTLPYNYYRTAFNCVTAVAIVLFTALFWWFVHNEYSRPLEDMTKLLLQSVQTGRRATLRLTRRTFIQLSESAQLIRAFNDCVRRLREIDAFIPEDVRRLFLQWQQRLSLKDGATNDTGFDREMAPIRSPRRRDTLRPHHVTMAHVTVRAWTAHAEAAATAAVAAAAVASGAVALQGGGARRGQRLAAVVERAAHAGGVANSGAFASAAAVAAFSAAVHELAAQHGGLVRNLTPDGCVVHFMAAVCAHLPRHGGAERGGGAAYDPAPLRASIDADAYAGLAFALALQRWVDARSCVDTAGTAAAPAMPNVRCLVDTGVYTCGQYRAPGSEQTLTVALGRDAQRVVGRAAALLGVRVAMTEETAVRVRPGPRAATEPGVRQLPVEALHTGRAGLDADAVILYEVLPGAAAGDAAWLAYARCCFDGFECMVRGDYAGALRAYRGVGEVGDLEPGLLPRCLSREAAHSSSVGGAVSVQVQRMMRECERRVAERDRSGYRHDMRSPFGIDAVLHFFPLELRVMAGVEDMQLHSCYDSARSVSTRSYRPCSTHSVMVSTETIRSVAVVRTVSGDVSCVVGNRPDVVVDSAGRSWWLSQNPHGNDAMAPLLQHYTALGSAGSMCVASFLPFRELQPLLTKAISNAPCGPLSDALRSAVPVHDATGKQRRAVAELFRGHHCLEHPNLLHCNAYSLSVEGCVVLLTNFAPGGSLRAVVARYAFVNVRKLAHFGLDILSALTYLHANGCVHGALSLDNTMVGSDGQCRLRGYFSDFALAQETFLLPCTCYMSPAMAAGHPPTPACDVFCYGLLMLEAVCRKQPWTWAEDADGEPYGTVEELKRLAAEGGQPFRTAVAAGRVVPDASGFVAACVAQSVPECVAQELLRCLSMNAMHRPSAADHWHVALRHLTSFYAP